MNNQQLPSWTFDTLHFHITTLIDLHQQADIERHQREHAAISLALENQRESIRMSDLAAAEAIRKAETATEKRFDAVNEFRAQLGDQARTFLPRPEYDVQQLAMNQRIAALEKTVNDLGGRKTGVTEGWGWAVAVIMFVITLTTVAVAMLGRGR